MLASGEVDVGFHKFNPIYSEEHFLIFQEFLKCLSLEEVFRDCRILVSLKSVLPKQMIQPVAKQLQALGFLIVGGQQCGKGLLHLC
jgi:hypothetical protein